MKAKSFLTILSAVFLTAGVSYSQSGRQTYLEALNLYQNGMFDRARTLFESDAESPESQGYAVLCAMKLRAADYELAFDSFLSKYGNTSLVPKMHHQYAVNLFGEGRYAKSAEEFDLVSLADIPMEDRPEAIFKRGYCSYADGDAEGARARFLELEDYPVSDYTASARYLSGYMDYLASDFAGAEKWFKLSIRDARFAELSDFYIVDCEFNQKNYDYVIENGVRIYDNVPEERKERLARIISESYLVKGDVEKARLYYGDSSHENMTRSDYFYAGSVLYAVQDYAGAIENYLKLENRVDSLGQIANYHLANAYLKTRNNVAAMNAFREASLVDFDKEIKEDASFNYAKLAFDLNKDTSGFKDYISRYSTKTKGEQIYTYMALAALVNRDYVAAIEAYDNIDELDGGMTGNYSKANYLRAEQLIGNGSWSDAVPYLRTVAYYTPRTDKFNQLSRYWLAESLYHTEKYSEARDIYTDLYNSSALQGRREGTLLPYNIAFCCFRGQDWQTGARWFDIVLSQDIPGVDREEMMTRRADCDFARHDYKAAISSYQNVLDAFGSADDIYPYLQQGLAYGLSGDRKKKAAVLSKVKEASPQAPLYGDAMYEYGRALMDLKDNNGAANTFRALRHNAPDSSYAAKALIGVGMANRNIRNYDKAINYYKMAVDACPDSQYSEEALLAIESLYQTKGQPEKYLEYIENHKLLANKSDSDKEDMYFNTAEQVFLAGNAQQAVLSLQKYIDEYPEGKSVAQAWFYLAEADKTLGNKEKAADCYSKAVAAGAEGSFAESARLGYAAMSYSLERFADAYEGYKDLLVSARIDDNRETAQTGMMRSAFRAREYENAIRSAAYVVSSSKSSAVLKREARYVQAKSLLATSRRAEAMDIFKELAGQADTAEGAESEYMLIQDVFDSGDFKKVEGLVYEFSEKAGEQSYWLAKAFIVLGDSFAERGMNSQATATFESILDGYVPSGSNDDVVDNVKQRLQRLQNK